DASGLHWRVPAAQALQPGEYTVTATVKDLSGNVGSGPSLTVQVEAADASRIPFERTQVVWVRFDLDRDGNGKPDFDDDLYKLGFMTAGAPMGPNDRMRSLVRAAYLARANQLYHRSDLGAPLGADSVAIRLAYKRPLGVPSMQIAVGGLDPEGTPNRG